MATAKHSESPASVPRREEELRVLEHAVSRSLADADSASAGLKAVIRTVCESESWDCGRYFRVDEEAGVLRFAGAWGVPDPTVERFIEVSRELTYRPGAGLSGKAWQSGQPLWSTDVIKDPRSSSASSGAGPTREMGAHGTFVFPVVSDGKTIGVLSFASRKARKPEERLRQTIHVIGSQLGQFLQRKQAEQVLRESEERFRNLTQLSSDIYWEQDREYRFTSFIGTGTERVHAASAYWVGKKRWERDYLNLSPADWAAHIALLDARKPFRDLELCRVNDAGDRIWISVSGEPVFDSTGEFIGYRGVGKDITARKREEQLRVLEHAVTRCLAEADSTSEAVKGVLRAVCETEHWECGRYFEPDDEAKLLRCHEAWCVPDPAIERFVEETKKLRFAPGVGLVGHAWQSGTPLWATDIATDPRTLKTAVAQSTGMRGIFTVPVLAEGRTLGVLAFSSSKPREPEERLLQAMRVIGSQVGQFLQRKQAEAVLRGSDARLRATFEQAKVGIHMTTVDGRFLQVNDKYCDIVGYPREELLRMNIAEVNFEQRRSDAPDLRKKVLAGEMNSFSLEKQLRRRDGSPVWATITISAVRGPDNAVQHFLSVVEDIIERKREEQLRVLEHAVTRSLAEADSESTALTAAIQAICETEGWEYGQYWRLDENAGVLRCDCFWIVPSAAVAIRNFLDKSRDVVFPRGVGLMGRVWESGEPLWVADISADPRVLRKEIVRETGLRGTFRFPVIWKGKTIGVFDFASRQIREPEQRLLQAIGVIGSQIGQFIQRKQAEDKVARLAQFDTVTGLPNRYLFHDRMSQTLAQAQRNRWQVGVLFIDLDRFKAVNDTYGHGVGDRLLSEAAARIKECVRGGDTVGRLAGDEFAVVLANLDKADDAGLVAQKIVTALVAPFDLDGNQIYISASIGIALSPGDGSGPDALVRNADTAMYRAKEQGRNSYQFYLPQMNERLVERLTLEARLRGALERGEFVLHYQPKVDLATGAISGLEALLRWKHEDRLVSPAEFVPILENTGLIVPVGEWVLRSACRQIKRWEQQGLAPRPVAVNVSARQFQRQNLAEMVGRALKDTGVEPGLVELELTETLLMGDAEEAVQTLLQLKALDVRLAVDDFGTGYSSLAYLKRFPLHILKIDRAFVRDAISDPDDAAIALTIINLAHSLKLKVVAEGVETEAQLNFLCLHGCDEMQGFYFARPLPVEECSKLLAEGRRLKLPLSAAAADLPVLLLLDDNEEELRRLAQALDAESFRILTATSPKVAFDILALHGARIVISDHRMPEMTGVEFLTKVRRLYPDTVRVIASGDGDAPTLTRAINRAGIHKFVSKTWGKEQLRAEVREATQQQH
jgi:diguanylate cyclase (GGDEF)-like protein/PAS domain S-box-containing protein